MTNGSLTLRLVDARQIAKRPIVDDAPARHIWLACGFTPLHLQTFLTAELLLVEPTTQFEFSTGLFDDLLGNIRRAKESTADTVVVVIEWADIDARLGVRRLGGWRFHDIADVVIEIDAYIAEFIQEILQTAQTKSVICCLPTLPLPPIFPAEHSTQELSLLYSLASLAIDISGHERIRVVSAQSLNELSPLPSRRDLKSELSTGFPYSLPHASAVAAILARLVVGRIPKKGLITDLDNTLWGGIIGEIGINGISWNLDAHTQIHGLYQQFLASLSDTGAMIAVASKNDPDVVSDAFKRTDMLLPEKMIFPFEVHWDHKSQSVRRILDTWNISADDAVFIDDNAMEIAEVQATFPSLETLQFPQRDSEFLPFLCHLRQSFGKDTTTPEDNLRTASIRAARQFHQSATGSPDDFLARANGTVRFASNQTRAFELFNKTNQFNLNGKRFTETEFSCTLKDPNVSLVTASYEDRFGPLGTIATLLVWLHKDSRSLTITSWVMSCRALSRRIEHHCLMHLFEKFEVDKIFFVYRPTARNSPMKEFLAFLFPYPVPFFSVRCLTYEAFGKHAPLLVHKVEQ